MPESIKSHLKHSDVFPNPDLHLTVLNRAPQIPFPSHTHDFSELVIVYNGKGVHFTEDEEYTVKRGDVFVLHGDRAHGYREIDDLKLVNILFDRENLYLPGMDLFDIKGYHALFTWEPRLRSELKFKSRLRLKRKDLAEALDYIKLIETELELKHPGYRFMSISLFMQLAAYLSRHYESSDVPEMKELSRISSILNYLEQNSSRFVNIAEILGIAGMSESSLLRLFKKNTGLSPIEYHSRMRIQQVRRLLKTTDMSITEIAYETGYTDSNYLSRQFKKITGLSPTEYRN